jgi:hypothetical protein
MNYEIFQQKIGCRSVMNTRSTFFSQHSQVRELRKKGGLGSGTCTCCLA